MSLICLWFTNFSFERQPETNALSIVSIITSILGNLSLLLSLCIPCGLRIVGLVLSAAGAIMGFISKKRIDESGGLQTGRKLALSRMILGLIGFVISLILILIFTLFATGAGLYRFF